MRITKDCDLTGILGYFDTFFDLPTPVMFSTGPQVNPQTVFFRPEKLAVKVSQTLSCKMVCKGLKTDARALKVSQLKKNWSLEAVLDVDVTQPVPLIPVLTATVKDKKASSNLLSKF